LSSFYDINSKSRGTAHELLTLVDNGRYDPTINIDYFPDTDGYDQPSYWTSTPYASNDTNAWIVAFTSGELWWEGKSTRWRIRAVRGTPYGAYDNFIIPGDGTITDAGSGLMWQQCNFGQTWNGIECTGVANTCTWEQALAYVGGLQDTNYLGYNDWRLPNRNELQSILDYSIYDPATAFPNTVAEDYWSSTTYNSQHTAWSVDFYRGTPDFLPKDHEGYVYVRAVRGGSCQSECLLSIKYKAPISAKLKKDKKLKLKISGGAGFDPAGAVDAGPFSVVKGPKVNTKKGFVQITVLVPAGFPSGSVGIRVGECYGEIFIL